MKLNFSFCIPEWPWLLRIVDKIHPGLISSAVRFGRAAGSREICPGITIDTKIERR